MPWKHSSDETENSSSAKPQTPSFVSAVIDALERQQAAHRSALGALRRDYRSALERVIGTERICQFLAARDEMRATVGTDRGTEEASQFLRRQAAEIRNKLNLPVVALARLQKTHRERFKSLATLSVPSVPGQLQVLPAMETVARLAATPASSILRTFPRPFTGGSTSGGITASAVDGAGSFSGSADRTTGFIDLSGGFAPPFDHDASDSEDYALTHNAGLFFGNLDETPRPAILNCRAFLQVDPSSAASTIFTRFEGWDWFGDKDECDINVRTEVVMAFKRSFRPMELEVVTFPLTNLSVNYETSPHEAKHAPFGNQVLVAPYSIVIDASDAHPDCQQVYVGLRNTVHAWVNDVRFRAFGTANATLLSVEADLIPL